MKKLELLEATVHTWTIRIGLMIVLLTLGWVLVDAPGTVLSQTDHRLRASDQLQLVSTLLPSTGIQQIVLLDPQEKSMAVYHVEPLQGKIQLKSVRRLRWDLQMEQFNAETPLPSELRVVQP